jgi:hypothetical protein
MHLNFSIMLHVSSRNTSRATYCLTLNFSPEGHMFREDKHTVLAITQHINKYVHLSLNDESRKFYDKGNRSDNSK